MATLSAFPKEVSVPRRATVACVLAVCTVVPVTSADDFDRAIEAEIARQQVPGLALAVMREGRIVRVGAYGYGDLEWRARTTPDTRFEIASMSKMFTGAAARILIDEGRLDPEAPVTRYFDGLPERWSGMKVRHLLTMSTGLPEDWGADLIPYDADVTTAFDDASMVRAFTRLEPVAPIGTEFHYSSPGYAMLGMIVSRVAGRPLPEFVADRVLKPAGMGQSSFIDNFEIVPERARGYRKAGGQLKKGWYLGQYLHARPDTGMLSTAGDLARWVIALRGGAIVKDSRTLWEGSTADSGRPLDYSYGWFLGTILGHRVAGHGGRYRTGFRSTLQTFLDDDVTVVVLANCDCANVDALAVMAARSVLPDLPDPAAPNQPDGDPSATASVIAALRSVAAGRIDAQAMTPDALEPLSLAEAAGFLKQVGPLGFAARGRVRGSLLVHGHRLVDYVTLEFGGPERHLLTVYRDDQGRIAYVEPTT
jgi:D-alanyl-D-alanine carboxypeptidase